MDPTTYFDDYAFAVNGSRIPIYSEITLDLDIGGRQCTWKFLVADVRQNLLGYVLLAHFKFTFDCGAA